MQKFPFCKLTKVETLVYLRSVQPFAVFFLKRNLFERFPIFPFAGDFLRRISETHYRRDLQAARDTKILSHALGVEPAVNSRRDTEIPRCDLHILNHPSGI